MAASTEDRQDSAPAEADIENAGAMAPIEKVETEDDFPSFKRVLLIMPAIYLSMFLVALVRSPPLSPQAPSTKHNSETSWNRIEPSSEPPFPRSPMSFILSMMLDGTQARTCLPLVLSNSSMDESTLFTLRNGSYSLPLPSSRLE
jgi:hypothetical protein